MISIARTIVRTVCRNSSRSNWPFASRNRIRLIDARLHAESSRNRYSLHGLEALIRPEFGQVCQSFVTSSNWTPGSPQRQAAYASFRHISRAGYVSATEWSVRWIVFQSLSRTTASMNASGTRTEWFAFW